MAAPAQTSDERVAARLAAARLLSARTALCVAYGVCCVLLVAGLTFTPVPLPGWAVIIAAVVLVASAGWVTRTLFPRQEELEPTGFAATVVDEPALYMWMVSLAQRLGVEPPGSIRLAPSTGVRVDDISGSPHLVIGIGWLTWLTEDELGRLASLELSMLRVRDEHHVRDALHIAASIDIDGWIASEARFVGKLVRAAGRMLDGRREALYNACLAWAAAGIPAALHPSVAEVGEARLADEGWQVLAERWIRPAARAGRALDSLALPHRELLLACEADGLLERTWVREESDPAMALLTDPAHADGGVCTWAATQASDIPMTLVGWDSYVDEVTMRNWRSSLRAGVAAATLIRGSAQTMNVSSLLAVAEDGRMSDLADELARDLSVPESVDDESADIALALQAETALIETVSDAVSLIMVEEGLAVPSIDILWGVRLKSPEGELIEVDATVRSFSRAGDWEGLRWYLEESGVDLERRPWTGGLAGGMPLGSESAVVAWRRGRMHDVLLVDGFLRAYRYGLWRQAKAMTQRLTGRLSLTDLGSELDEVENTAQGPPQPAVALALGDVNEAELFRRPHGLTWTVRLRTSETTWRFTGPGSGSRIAPMLQSALADRLSVTGLGVRPTPFLRTLGKLGWYVIWGGVLVLLAGAVGYLLGTNDSSGTQRAAATVDAISTFGVLGAALIAIGLIPYLFIAKRGHRPA